MMYNAGLGPGAVNSIFPFLEKHGPSLKKLKFEGFQSLGTHFTDEHIQKIEALCPKLEFFDLGCHRLTKIPHNKAFFGDGQNPDLKINHQMTHCFISGATNHTWAELSHPSINNLRSLAVFGGITKDNFIDNGTFGDVPDYGQVEIVDIFKNNPNLKYCDFSLYNHQLQTIAPFCKNLTTVCWVAMEFSLETWRILGRELISLHTIKSVDCGRLSDPFIQAWVSEMPADSQIRTVEHRYSNVSPLAIARDVAPKCPKLCHLRTDGVRWKDECLYAWADCPRRLFELEVFVFQDDMISWTGLLAYIEQAGSELRRLRVTATLALSDSFIQLLVEHCPHLASIEIDGVTGVTSDGWEALRILAPWRDIKIGSDTLSHEFITSLCSNPPTQFFLSPSEKQAKREKELSIIQAKEEEKRRRITVASEWGEAFFEEHKAKLLEICEDRINDLPNEALNLAKHCTIFPDTMTEERQVMENRVKSMGVMLKGEMLKKQAEEKRKREQEEKAQRKRELEEEAQQREREKEAKQASGDSKEDCFGDFF